EDDSYARGRRAALEFLDQLVAVHTGHSVIADQDVGRVIHGLEQGVRRVAGSFDVGHRRQALLKHSQHHGIVVHQQNFDVVGHKLMLLAAVVSALAAGLAFEYDMTDLDALVQGLTHVVHSQRSEEHTSELQSRENL